MKQNLNSPKKKKTEFAFVTKNLPTNKIPSPDVITGEFQQIVKKELISILHKQQEHLSTQFMRHRIPNTEN